MSDPFPGLSELERSLSRVRWGVLATLAVGALVIWTGGAGGSSRGLGPATTTLALLLAVGSIVTRQRAARGGTPVRLRARLLLASLLLAGGVGGVGLAVALAGGDTQTSLLLVAAGAIFALRPLPPVGPGARRA